MCKSSGLVWGAALCLGLLPASWASAQKPDQKPNKAHQSKGDNVKQPEAGNRNAPAAREGDNAGRRAGEAKDKAVRDADRAKDNATRRDNKSRENKAREKDPGNNNTRNDNPRNDAARPRDGQRHEVQKPEIDARDRNPNRQRRDSDFGAAIDFRDNRLHLGDVTRDSIAARAGMRQGDVIYSVDGHRIDSRRDFDRYFYRARGPRVPIIVLRGDDRHTVYYDSGWFVDNDRRFDNRVAAGGAWLGVYLDYDQTDRALLRGVEPNSPADRAGLRSGDTVVRVNDQEIHSPADLNRLIGERQPGEQVEVTLADSSADAIVVTLGERPVNRGAAVDVSPRGIDVDAGGVDVNVSPRGVDVDLNRDRRRGRR